MPKITLKNGSAEFADHPEDSLKDIRRCDMPGCNQHAEHKAPMDRSLGGYYHFCLEHVQEYNRAWDYFSGMSATEVKTTMENSLYGDRPTWKYGVNGDLNRILEDRAWQEYRYTEAERPKTQRREMPPHYHGSPEFEAMAIMGLQPPLTMTEIKDRYKTLAKTHHPDRNPGDPEAEETLKKVNMAYTILKLAYDKYEKIKD